MKGMRIKLLFVFFILFLYIASSFLGAYYHELSHKETAEKFGCTASIDMMKWRPSTHYTCYNLTKEERLEMLSINRHLDNGYENISYEAYAFIIIMLLTILVIKK